MRHEQEPNDIPFWTIDEELGELELQERPGGPDLYTVRLKARTQSSPYQPTRELYPLEHRGTQHEIWGKAYILVPDITLTVGLYRDAEPSGAIGRVTESHWQGMRHHDIATVRALYFVEDRALAIWEVDAWGRLTKEGNRQLWHLFEAVLVERFPEATHIFADDAEPGDETEENRAFLRLLGYRQVGGTHRIVRKNVDHESG